jgi:hypothetical protein
MKPLIPLLTSGDDENNLFVPRQVEDAELLELWHKTVLPSFVTNPAQWEGLSAAHLFRQGRTEQESLPVILVSICDGTEGTKTSLRERFSQFFNEPLRCSLRISFEVSVVHRSGASYMPPICEARNTSFQKFPRSGASIGIQGKLDCTATMGGYLLVDGQPHFLTVDHIVSKELAKDSLISITHPSEQEGQNSPPWIVIENFLKTLRNCCDACHELWREHHKSTNFYQAVDPTKTQCPASTEFKKLKDELFREFPAEVLGTMTYRSGTRSRSSLESDLCHETEMDWALVTVDRWAIPLDSHIRELSKDLHFSSVVLGARVKSTGRTSGEQTGKLNTARSIVKHQNPTRFTEEHSVIKDSRSSLNEWISGGVGVDGDSGSWIIDQDSGALYGMVWGRDRIKTNPICLFSPIVDIAADIKEKTGAKTVCLPGQEAIVPVPRKDKGKESFSIPTAFVSRRTSEGGASQSMFSNMVSSTG